jgi:hypothetical protein
MVSPKRTLAILFFLSCCAASVHAQAAAAAHHGCAWLTEGSAASLLGGEVAPTASLSDSGEGSCKFMRRQEPFDSLEVTISKSALPTCPPNSTNLVGVGNPTSMCKISGAHGLTAVLISGRVRDFYFTVSVDYSKRKAPPQTTELREDLMAQVADQVAGNLF